MQRWPVDKIRPEPVSFQTLMKKRLLKYENPAKAAQSATVKSNDANVQPVNLTWNEQKEVKQANALYALLENRFANESPFHDRLRFPASSPSHYDLIIAEAEKAPSRGFFENLTNRLKGMIRVK